MRPPSACTFGKNGGRPRVLPAYDVFAMSLRGQIAWEAVWIGGGLLAAYVAAYLTLPRHFVGGGVRTSYVRAFKDGSQPYLFAPAGFVEAAFIRVARAFHRPNPCGEEVVLLARGVRFRFRSPPVLRLTTRP